MKHPTRPWRMGRLLTLGCLVVHASSAFAQIPAPGSAAAAMDLSRVPFDTTTRVFAIGPALEKNAHFLLREVDGRPITLGELGDEIAALPSHMRGQPFDVLYPSMIAFMTRKQAMVIQALSDGLDQDPVVKRRMATAANTVLVNEWLHRRAAAIVQETDILARYDRDIAGKPGPDEVRLSLIAVATEADAEALLTELNHGADFADVARRVSRDTTAVRGGDLGFVPRAYLTPEIGAAAFALKPGERSASPIKSNKQWYIIKVVDRRAGPAPSFAAAHDYIADTLQQEQVAALAKAAMTAVKVREYALTGHETDESVAQK